VKLTYTKVLEPHQRTRIEIMLGLKTDPKGAGYNVIQSKIAIGSGQAYGRGFLQGTQTKYGYVPEQSTDFIFSTIGEEWGFAGCTVVIGLYAFLLLRLINLAERQRSTFSRVYGYCVASIIFFHVFNYPRDRDSSTLCELWRILPMELYGTAFYLPEAGLQPDGIYLR